MSTVVLVSFSCFDYCGLTNGMEINATLVIWDIIIADLWNRRDVRVNAICFELSQKNSETTHHVGNGTAFSCESTNPAGNLLFCKISVITTNGAEIVVEQPKCVAIVIIGAFTL